MKSTKFILLAVLLVGFIVCGCKKSEPETKGNHATQYTCTMHPEVVQDAPGNCPKCGMKLVEKH